MSEPQVTEASSSKIVETKDEGKAEVKIEVIVEDVEKKKKKIMK